MVGLLLILGGNGLVVLAETEVPSGLAALLIAAVPMWLVVLRTATGDRPPLRTLGGVLLGFAGLAVLTRPGIGGAVQLSGVLLVLVASVLWSLGSFSASKLSLPGNPFTGSAYQMLAGGAGGIAVGLLRGEHRGWTRPASPPPPGWRWATSSCSVRWSPSRRTRGCSSRRRCRWSPRTRTSTRSSPSRWVR